jgi:hypothetical protein
MYTFDASSVVHAWDNYPIENFPGMWDWFEKQISTETFIMSEVAFDEVFDKFPDCGDWLKNKGISKITLSNGIMQQAIIIKQMLGIVEDNYHGNGVGENDLLIIATAKIEGLPLISEENRQPKRPQNKGKYKIPAVCDLPTVGVDCFPFIDLIKSSGETFR